MSCLLSSTYLTRCQYAANVSAKMHKKLKRKREAWPQIKQVINHGRLVYLCDARIGGRVDTAVQFADGTVTGSVARSGSFRGAALIVADGTDAAALKEKLRDLGIFVEGPITALDIAHALRNNPL